MARSGNYEVDDEGNLVAVGEEGAVASRPAVADVATEGRDDETPPEVRKLLLFYDLGRFVTLAVLVVVAITMPDIRAILLIVAVVYLLASFPFRALYRRALIRGTDREA